ncbi:MAG TPA: inositol oxygenase family protein [Burkholderiaceae bacterium]|nr:inositol oxygenase family protein [Burkholderiaceae bacterium]
MNRLVSFTQMKAGTREDYLLLDQSERDFALGLPERVLQAMRDLDHSVEGYPVTRLEHSLQSATRARRDGADDELVLAALLHDMGDLLAPYNHAAIAAAVIRPYVREEVHWIVEQHGLFQTYYYVHHLGGDRHMRERLRDHRWYEACAHFCEHYDQSSFDPRYPSLPLEEFEPLVRDIFSRPPHDPRYTAAASAW